MRWLNMHELTNLFVRYASKAQHVATVDDEKRLVLEKNTWSSLTIAYYRVQIRFIENADDKNGRHRWQNRRIGKSMWKYGKKNVGRDELCFQCFQSQVLTHSGSRKYCPSNKGQCNVYIVYEFLTFVLFHFRPYFNKWYLLRLLIVWRLIEIEINWFLK